MIKNNYSIVVTRGNGERRGRRNTKMKRNGKHPQRESAGRQNCTTESVMLLASAPG